MKIRSKFYHQNIKHSVCRGRFQPHILPQTHVRLTIDVFFAFARITLHERISKKFKFIGEKSNTIMSWIIALIMDKFRRQHPTIHPHHYEFSQFRLYFSYINTDVVIWHCYSICDLFPFYIICQQLVLCWIFYLLILFHINGIRVIQSVVLKDVNLLSAVFSHLGYSCQQESIFNSNLFPKLNELLPNFSFLVFNALMKLKAFSMYLSLFPCLRTFLCEEYIYQFRWN